MLCSQACPAVWHLAVTPVKLASLALGIGAAFLISMVCTPHEKLNTGETFTASKSYLATYLYGYLHISICSLKGL